jgi:hypothetical protein
MDPILRFALENRDYFSWPTEVKQEVGMRFAEWITKVSLHHRVDRADIIRLQREEAIKEDEMEYLQLIQDVETFFKTKNWLHVCDDNRVD